MDDQLYKIVYTLVKSKEINERKMNEHLKNYLEKLKLFEIKNHNFEKDPNEEALILYLIYLLKKEK